ncbi:MAG: hypothetical protein II225_03820 [Ruminococcus sp.]|nr:hypothetical protein [Ruminococcus sp.]
MKTLFNNKKIAFLLAVVLMLSCFMLTACNNKGDDATADEAAAATADEVQSVTVAEKEFASLKDSYKPAMAFDKEGNSVDLTTVYGSSFKETEAELCFKKDGTFTAFIGAYANEDSVTGTYKVKSQTEIEMLYNNDKTQYAVITVIDVDVNAVEIRLPVGDYNVIFQ